MLPHALFPGVVDMLGSEHRATRRTMSPEADKILGVYRDRARPRTVPGYVGADRQAVNRGLASCATVCSQRTSYETLGRSDSGLGMGKGVQVPPAQENVENLADWAPGSRKIEVSLSFSGEAGKNRLFFDCCLPVVCPERCGNY